MNLQTIAIPENSLVQLLQSLPEKTLIDIFWKTFVKSDDSPLSTGEKREIEKAKTEFSKGETVPWRSIR